MSLRVPLRLYPKAFLLLHYLVGLYLPVSGSMYQDQPRSQGPLLLGPRGERGEDPLNEVGIRMYKLIR